MLTYGQQDSSFALGTMDGIFLLDKPRGPSSRHAIDRFARQLPRKLRFGHAGTLDPLASGLLILATGKATRLIEIYQDLKKTYIGTVQLGVRSATDDSEGPLTPADGVPLPRLDEVLVQLGRFTGRFEQTPPAFSAAKVEGKRAYALARAGRAELPRAKWVDVHTAELLSYEDGRLTVRWEVGSGTYIRSLARDLGEALGCGGYLESLRRTQIGPFTVETASSIEPQESDGFIAMEESIAHLPQFRLSRERCRTIVAGRKIALNEAEKAQWTQLIAAMRSAEPEPGPSASSGLTALIDPGQKMLGILEIRPNDEGELWARPWKFFQHVKDIGL